MILTVAEWGEIRRGRKFAHLCPRSENYTVGKLTYPRRIVPIHDPETGDIVRHEIQAIREPNKDGEDIRRVPLTVTYVEDVDILGTGTDIFRALNADDARSCGFYSRQGLGSLEKLRTDWRERHPRMDFARMVWFLFGDRRDRNLYMQHTGSAGGDYTRASQRAMDVDAPVLTREEYAGLGMAARQREARERAAASKRLAEAKASQRLAQAEAGLAEIGAKMTRVTRAIDDRLDIAERREGIGK